MAQTIQQILQATTFYSDDEPYLLLRLPVNAITVAAVIVAEISDPFCVLIVDKDEVTLVVPHEATEEFANRLRGHEVSATAYRLLTMDVALSPDLTGFMATISRALADVGIPIFPYSAYTRDHILVPAEQFDVALATLEKLKAEA